MAKELSNQAQKIQAKAEQRRLKLLAVERARSTREKYEIKAISGWMYFGPVLGFVIALVVGLIMWLSHISLSSESYWFFGLALAPFMVIGIASDVQESWKAAQSAKHELSRQLRPDGSVFSELQQPYYAYKFDYIYTDSLPSFVTYQFAKIMSVIYTLASGVAVAILLFLWIGTISIAPTTIIIILLLIIINNQSSR